MAARPIIQDTEGYINDENEKLRQQLKENQRFCATLRNYINYLNNQIMDLKHNKRVLIKELKRSKNSYLYHLQCSGKLCAQNCVLCVVLWICQKKLGLFPCGCQLLLLLFRSVCDKIERENLVCPKLVTEILMQCGLVKIVFEAEYPLEMEARLTMIDEVWSVIMTMPMDNVNVLILGKVTDAIGHASLCDLDTKNE